MAALALLLMMKTVSAQSDTSENSSLATEQGIVIVESNQDVETTAISLTTALADAGLTVFGVIDHAANASNAGLDLPPTLLILVGNPNLGTPLMQESRSIALDLPQKFVVWEESGQVYISYNDPTYLAERHGITGEEEILDQIENALQRFANMAAGTMAAGTMGETGAMTDTQPMTGTESITGTDAVTASIDLTTTAPTDELTGVDTMSDTGSMTETTAMTGTSTMTDTSTMTGTAGAMESTVLMQFDDTLISATEFDRAFVRAMRNFADQQGIPINDTTIFFFTDLRNRYLEQFATERVLLAEAAARGIEISDDEAIDRIWILRSQFLDDAAYQAALEAAGFADEEELIAAVKDEATINALLRAMLADIDISDDEIRTFYEENQEQFRVSRGVILPLEQVEAQIRQLLIQQALQERIADLRAEQSVEIFTGNLTPFDQLLMSELGVSSTMTETVPMTGTAPMTDAVTITDTRSIADNGMLTETTGMTGTTGMTSTEAITAADIIAPDEIPPIPITETDTVTDVQPITATNDITGDVTGSDSITASIDVVPATEIPPISITETDTITDVQPITLTQGMTGTGSTTDADYD